MADVGNAIIAIGESLKQVSSTIQNASAASAVPEFHGQPAQAEDFIRCLDNFFDFTQNDEATISCALTRSRGIASITIQNFKKNATGTPSWAALKTELEKNFGLFKDQQTALAILRQTKQAHNMSVHQYAQLVAYCAQKAFPPPIDLSHASIQIQLVEIFTYGIANPHIKRKFPPKMKPMSG